MDINLINHNHDKLFRINKRWSFCQLAWYTIVPQGQAAGVYVLYHDKEAVYIGSSKNLYQRFAGHKSALLAFHNRYLLPMERFYFKFKICQNFKQLEKRLINRLQPFWNTNSNPNPIYKAKPGHHIITPLRVINSIQPKLL